MKTLYNSMFLKTTKKTNFHCGRQMGFVKKNVLFFNCFKQNQIQQINTTKLQAFHTINNANSSVSVEYSLDNFHRSNQDTALVHKPSVFEGQWVQSGDLLADCSASVGGELSLGQNILIAYMPWEGYNFEDAILISERLVYDDLYTSIHIERYEIDVRETKLGMEEITRVIPEISDELTQHLNPSGIAKLGSWIQEGDILVGKVTPINKKNQSNYQKLLYTILEKPVLPVRDSSLRAPKGIKAKIVGIQIFKNNTKNENQKKLPSKKENSLTNSTSLLNSTNELLAHQKRALRSPEAPGPKNRISLAQRAFALAASYNQHNAIFYQNQNQIRSFSLNINNQTTKKLQSSQKRGILLSNSIKSFYSQNEHTLPLYPFTPPLRFLKTLYPLYPPSGGLYRSGGIRKGVYTEAGVYEGGIRRGYSASDASMTRWGGIGFSLKSHLIKSDGFSSELSSNGQKAKDVVHQKNVSFWKLRSRLSKNLTYNALNYNKAILKPQKHEQRRLNNVSSIQIYLAEKRRIQVGDKMAGRHGNKGIISQILPIEDMPFLPDGTPLDLVLNPLGVPSRMNVGQIYECLLGLAGRHLGENFKVFPFDEIYGAEASRSFVYSKLYEARLKSNKNWIFNPNTPGKMRLYDGRTGETFNQPVTVGYAYMIRLVHMVDDKIHARSTGPYSLVTQQPLRGRSKQGGQRLGEMEVWALEGYGAAFTLLEMLTIKSDDMTGRMTLWSNLILNKEISIGTPESFKVLICELQALCLDVGLFKTNSKSNSFF
jgi:DNA-directed RNA polymerase beta subunit